MKRKLCEKKTMYAIFVNGKTGQKYVQPCKITSIQTDGFYANCHNGNKPGHSKGIEFFPNESIGNGVFFSKDTAELKIKQK